MKSIRQIAFVGVIFFSACSVNHGAESPTRENTPSTRSPRYSDQRSTAECGLENGIFEGHYAADAADLESTETILVMEISNGPLRLSLGSEAVAIFVVTSNLQCVDKKLLIQFKDNWGNAGRAAVTRTIDGDVQLQFSELEFASESGSRNFINYYPSLPVNLHSQKRSP